MIAAAPAALDEAIGITKFETLGHNPCGPAWESDFWELESDAIRSTRVVPW